jgi:hypothetical protein
VEVAINGGDVFAHDEGNAMQIPAKIKLAQITYRVLGRLRRVHVVTNALAVSTWSKERSKYFGPVTNARCTPRLISTTRRAIAPDVSKNL